MTVLGLRKLCVACVVCCSLAGCTSGEARHMLLEAVLTTEEHKALVADPKMLVGSYYEAPSNRDVCGSTSFDAALESQTVDQSSKDQVVAKYSQKTNFDDFKSKNVLLNEGINEENAKANVLMKVIDGKSTGPRSTAVEVLVLNKKYAGYKLWIGSEEFLVNAHKIPCPIVDPSALEFNSKVDKNKSSKTKPQFGAKHFKKRESSDSIH